MVFDDAAQERSEPRRRRRPPSRCIEFSSSGTSRHALNFGLLNLGGSFFIRAQA